MRRLFGTLLFLGGLAISIHAQGTAPGAQAGTADGQAAVRAARQLAWRETPSNPSGRDPRAAPGGAGEPKEQPSPETLRRTDRSGEAPLESRPGSCTRSRASPTGKARPSPVG